MNKENRRVSVIPPWSPHPYVIHPLLTYIIEPFPLSMLTYLNYFGEVGQCAVGFFYIAGVNNHHILVDTGMPSTTVEAAGFSGKEISTAESALSNLGLHPDDIDFVILTHLHYDHCENLRLFRNAKVIVQRSELKSTSRPPIAQADFYNPEFWSGADFQIVDGDLEIFPGLWVIHTPGHSIGSQSVLVDIQSGRHILFGQCALDTNINEEITTGVHTDADKAHRNMLRVKKMTDRIITLHDVNSFNRTYA